MLINRVRSFSGMPISWMYSRGSGVHRRCIVAVSCSDNAPDYQAMGRSAAIVCMGIIARLFLPQPMSNALTVLHRFGSLAFTSGRAGAVSHVSF